MDRIFVDCMENKAVIQHLQQLGCEVEIKDLRPPHGKGGDYVLGDGKVGIERKRIKDLILSLVQQPDETKRSKHLYEQLNQLKNYETGIFLIEGEMPVWIDDWHVPIDSKVYKIHRNTLLGVMVWCIRHGIFVLQSRSLEESTRIIALYSKKLSQKQP